MGTLAVQVLATEAVVPLPVLMLTERSAVSCNVAAAARLTGFAATVPAVLQDTGISYLLGSRGAGLSSPATCSVEQGVPCMGRVWPWSGTYLPLLFPAFQVA